MVCSAATPITVATNSNRRPKRSIVAAAGITGQTVAGIPGIDENRRPGLWIRKESLDTASPPNYRLCRAADPAAGFSS